MCALVRLSLVSDVCEPVTSILLIVAVMLKLVSPAPNWKRAVPYELFRRAPVVKVGLTGGTSCEFVRLTIKSVVDMFAVVSLFVRFKLSIKSRLPEHEVLLKLLHVLLELTVQNRCRRSRRTTSKGGSV